jgi:hypothetical protein
MNDLIDPSTKKGTETIKKAILAVVGFGNMTGRALDDGRLDLKDLGVLTLLPPAIIALWQAVTNVTDLKAELADLDQAEIQELKDFFKKEFDIPEEDIEKRIEQCADLIDTVRAGYSAIVVFSTIFRKK